MNTALIIIWILNVIGIAVLLGRHIAKKYGVPVSRIKEEMSDERRLKKLWRKEMG